MCMHECQGKMYCNMRVRRCCGLALAGSSFPPRLITHSPSWMREGVERITVRKIVVWDKGRLIIKAVVCTGKVKLWILSLLPTDKQVFSHPRKAGVHQVDGLGRQTPSLQMSSLPPSPSFYCQAQHLMVWMSLWSPGASCPHCACSQPLVHPQPCCHVEWCCWSEWLKHLCVSNTVFIMNP